MHYYYCYFIKQVSYSLGKLLSLSSSPYSSLLTCVFNHRLLTEDPNQRLGAQGAAEVILVHDIGMSFLTFIYQLYDYLDSNIHHLQVKQHPFFRDINWDTLARQKVRLISSLTVVVLATFSLLLLLPFKLNFPYMVMSGVVKMLKKHRVTVGVISSLFCSLFCGYIVFLLALVFPGCICSCFRESTRY